MVRRALRSRSKRKVKVKTPGSRVVIHYRRKKPQAARCHKCGTTLKGVPRAFPKQLQNMPKTQKRPERPYGGVLCSTCSRILFKDKAKSLS